MFLDILNKYKDSKNIFYKYRDEVISYSDLYNKVLYYSDLLRREGVSPVIIYGHKEVNVVILIISCLVCGRAYVPIDSSTPYNRVLKIKKDCNSSLLINNDLDKLIDYKDCNIKENNNDIAYIIYTSGTTGNPKGVPIKYDNLFNFINWINKVISKDNKVILNQANYSFDLSVVDLYFSLSNGYTLVSIDRECILDYNSIFDTISINDINLLVITPTFGRLLFLNKDFNYNNYKCIKTIYFCGERLDKDLVIKIMNNFPDINIINAYGPTEATSAVSAINIDKSMLNYDYLPVGETSNFATNIDIVNDEIVLSGKSVFDGYINSVKIDKYHTNDKGFIKDNMLFCIGRLDNQIKLNGYRIELDEIDNLIINKFNIKAVTVGVKDGNNKIKYLRTFVENYNEVSNIFSYLKSELPIYSIPKIITNINKIPLNNNNKIDRKALEDYD